MTLEAVKRERTSPQLAAGSAVHPATIRQWSKAPLDGLQKLDHVKIMISIDMIEKSDRCMKGQ
jgi:hypothetical protein